MRKIIQSQKMIVRKIRVSAICGKTTASFSDGGQLRKNRAKKAPATPCKKTGGGGAKN